MAQRDYMLLSLPCKSSPTSSRHYEGFRRAVFGDGRPSKPTGRLASRERFGTSLRHVRP